MSTCLYLSVVSLVELIVLYTRCGNEWLVHMIQLDLSQKLMIFSESICKVYPFVFNFLFHLSRWLTVACSVEGFISVKYPERLEHWCNLDRARAVILLLTVLLICANMHFFWSYELVPMDDMSLPGMVFCTFTKYGHEHSEAFQNVIWPMFDMVISDVLPYLIVISCSIVMAVQICRKQHRGSNTYQQWELKYTLDSTAVNHCKIILFIIGILFLCLTLPKFTHGIFQYLMDKEYIEYSVSLDAKSELAGAIVNVLEYLFFCSKFMVYLIFFPRFRIELVSLFTCLPVCQQLHYKLQMSKSASGSLLHQDQNKLSAADQSIDDQTDSLITSL